MPTIPRFAIIGFLVFVFTGCAVITHKEQIRVLRDLSDSHAQSDRFLKRQEQGFGRLKEDIAQKRLKEGVPMNTVVLRYSEPIYCRQIHDAPEEKMCLYRNPRKYFNTDAAQLYFDANETLVSWKYTPAQK